VLRSFTVLGAITRQTQKERNGEARDQQVWNDIHNSMDRLHRLSMQVTPLVRQWNKLTADQIDDDALGKQVHPILAGALGYYL
jgi:hypothetical protein